MKMCKFLPYGEKYYKNRNSFSFISYLIRPLYMSKNYRKFVCSGYNHQIISIYRYCYSSWG